MSCGGTSLEHAQTIPDRPEGEETGTRRRRGGRRTVLLIAGAVALGVLAGTVTGYAIQYDREPTPLPPLAQQEIAQPKPQAPNESTSTRSINANRWHKTDDDLAKMLIEAPSGAKVAASGYESPDEFSARYYEHPNQGLGFQLRNGIRRIAARRWFENDTNYVSVELFQFADRSGAIAYQDDNGYLGTEEYAGNPGKDLAGVPAAYGHVWIDSRTHEKPGYYPTRSARVVARRGDIVMEIEYTNNRGTIDENTVVELAKRQWERL
ncbi:hypothetical protein CP980_18340 [Streptomyces vinaceus]|uniref:Uncharacterized protein n=1 Tax=Streptomyces vinaceus TaxID=1960 RepID=A0A5J6JDI2_STRVI|nr:hypothetical protein CP980_18340 [Streptomyces vinaceus]